MREFTEQEQVRRDKVKDLMAKGVKPFGARFDVTSNSKMIKEKYESRSKEELEEIKERVVIAGRIMTKRRKEKQDFSISKINTVKFKYISVLMKLEKRLMIYLKLLILAILLELKDMFLERIPVNLVFMRLTILI